MSSPPWVKPGVKGKPNGHHRPAQTQLEARLLATLRSELHNALSYKGESQNVKNNQQQSQQAAGGSAGNQPQQPLQQASQQQRQLRTFRDRDWSHRKAEWVCQKCEMRNFITRMDCRKCGHSWSKACKFIAAGSPPLPFEAPVAPPVPKDERLAPTSVQAAEQALTAARAAGAPDGVIQHWDAEIERRKSIADASKQAPSLRARLATATAEANAAMQARERAVQQLTAAKEQVIKVEEALQSARQAEEKAAAHLKQVTAEVGSPQQQEPVPARVAAEDAQATEACLQAVLEAYATAAKEGASPEDKQALEETLQKAKDEAAARAATREEAAQKVAEAEARAQAMTVERAEGTKRKGDDEEPFRTQVGDRDLTDDELDVLLEQVPPGKRQRAKERLTQLGVAD